MGNKIDSHKTALKEKQRKENILWRTLLECLSEIAELNPWDKIPCKVPFAYIPESNDQMIFFSCVQEADDSKGFLVYPSPRDYQYGTLSQESEKEETRQFIEMENYGVFFTKKDDVPEEIQAIYTQLAVDFGDGLWPWVSHKRHGYWSQTPHEQELAFVVDCLDNLHMQLLALQEIDAIPDYENGEMLLRYYSAEDDLWYNVIAPFAIPPEVISTLMMTEDSPLMEELSQLPVSTSVPRMEFDFGWLDEPVQDEENDIPYFPLHVVVTDRQADKQLSLYHCKPEDFIGCALTALSEVFRKHGIPETLYVCRDESYDLFEDLTQKLGIQLKRVKHLPSAERILRALDAV